MREVVKMVYTYDELSEEAKERAIEEISEIPACDDWSDEEASIKAIANHIGAEVDYSVGAFTHSYVSFDVSLGDDVSDLRGVRAYKWIWNNWISPLYSPKVRFSREHKKLESKCQSWISCPFTGYYMDDCIRVAWKSFCDNLDSKSDVEDFITELEGIACKWWQEDMESRYEREYIEEMYVDDYEYLEDGTIYR